MTSVLERPVTILLTSVGNEAIHGFVDDLRDRAPDWRLVGTDIRSDAAGLYRCDGAHIVPRRTAPSYLSTIRELVQRHRVDLVLPLSTEDQAFFCQRAVQQALAPAVVVVSSPDAVAKANGKVSLFEALARLNSVLPEFAVVKGPAEAVAALRTLCERHGAALLKTESGTGGRGMLCVGTPDSDPAPARGRQFLPLEALDAAAAGDPLALLHPPLAGLVDPSAEWPRLAVAYLPGAEYSVDVLADEGETLAAVVRERSAADGGLATVAQVVSAPDVEDAARLVAEALHLSYVNNIQFRRDKDGTPRLLEINPRIPGTICLTVEAGLNLPLAACCLALGEKMTLPAPEIGVQVMRFAGAVFTRRPAEPIDD